MSVLELLKAIKAEAVGDVDLQAATAQSGNLTNGIFYGLAPKNATKPYVTFNIIVGDVDRCFSAASDVQIYTVQFSIFTDADENSSNISPAIIGDIRNKLVAAFDRAALTYDTKTHVGCLKVNEIGPTLLERAWMYTIDFEIMFS